MLTIQNILLFLSVIFSGMIAGLFYSYACSVNIGLGRLSDMEYLKAMQSINNAILNPAFFISFFGALVILPITTWFNYTPSPGFKFYILLIAALIYIVGVFGVTVFGNIPLNNDLAKFNIETASSHEITDQRLKFEISWNRYNLIRTVASLLSFALCVISVLLISN